MGKVYKIFAIRVPPYTDGKEDYSFPVNANNEQDAFLKAKKILADNYNVDPTGYHVTYK